MINAVGRYTISLVIFVFYMFVVIQALKYFDVTYNFWVFLAGYVGANLSNEIEKLLKGKS